MTGAPAGGRAEPSADALPARALPTRALPATAVGAPPPRTSPGTLPR
ncbi:hypothetical protein ACFWA9_13355 [Kitasatospora sp. NPDC059973]